MIDHDEPEDESGAGGWDGPSRSQRRREALDVLELARRLMDVSEAQLARLPLDESMRALVRDSQRIKQQIARKRQTQFLAKHLRREDDATLTAIRTGLDHAGSDARRDTARLHEAEHWREHLLADGDAALADFIAAHASADRQHLRQLVRNAHTERLQNKPPHALRELFRALREVLDEPGIDEPGMENRE